MCFPSQIILRFILSVLPQSGHFTPILFAEFSINLQSSIDLETLQNLPLQKRLHDSYQNLAFKPIKELLPNK